MVSMLKIREIRLSKGISQADLAARCNLSRSYLSMIESGQKHPNAVRLRKIAAELGVPAAALLADEDETEELNKHLALMADLSPEDQQAVIALARHLARRSGD